MLWMSLVILDLAFMVRIAMQIGLSGGNLLRAGATDGKCHQPFFRKLVSTTISGVNVVGRK